MRINCIEYLLKNASSLHPGSFGEVVMRKSKPEYLNETGRLPAISFRITKPSFETAEFRDFNKEELAEIMQTLIGCGAIEKEFTRKDKGCVIFIKASIDIPYLLEKVNENEELIETIRSTTHFAMVGEVLIPVNAVDESNYVKSVNLQALEKHSKNLMQKMVYGYRLLRHVLSGNEELSVIRFDSV